jgi:hypothetical protein
MNRRCFSQGQGNTINCGNVAVVDAVYGNDFSASVGGFPYKTIGKAVSAVQTGQTVWILPGTYTLSSGITLKNGTSMRGLSLQTTIIQMNVTGSATMLTMGENCRVEDLTFNLVGTGSTDQIILKGIVFGGTSSQTSKLRTSVVTVRNSTMAKTLSSTVTGVEFNGTGTLNSSVFSFNSLKGSTINVYSNGLGEKRGILVSGTNQASTRDLNVYVAAPPDTDSAGSYVGIETDDPANTGSIQMRSTTVGVTLPIVGNTYTASDILQTTPSSITDPTYLATPGIQIGPGTDLVTKSAGSKGFSTYVYPTIIYYGLRGNITSAPSGGFLWPGTQSVSAGQYPDTGIPAAYFRAQQPTIISGLSVSVNSAPGTGNTLTAAIYYSPISTNRVSIFNGYISGNTLIVSSGLVGTLAVGQTVSGPGVAINTYIVSGSGSSWTVFPSQTVGSGGATIVITTGSPSSSFVGKINNGNNNDSNGTVLTITPPITGELYVGQYIAGAGVTAGTFISASTANPNVWTVSISQNVAPNTTIYSNGLLATPFTVTFGATDTQKTFYNASHRLNTGDRVHLFVSYTSGSPANAAHDVTAQIDLF